MSCDSDRGDIAILDPPEPSSFEGKADPKTLRKKFMRGFSLFKRESQRTIVATEPAIIDAPATVDGDNDTNISETSSIMRKLVVAPLIDVEPHVGSPITLKELEDEAVRTDVALTKAQFGLRVAAPPLSPLNVSPASRETFETMVWALLIIRQPGVTHHDVADSVPRIPVIRTMPIYEVKLVSSDLAALAIPILDNYFLRTEALVRVYSMPPHVITKLAVIATEINNSIFARYMGARGKWSLRSCFGGLQVLLRWWGATSPHFVTQYSSAVSLQAVCVDNYTRSKLRLELRDLLGIGSDQEDYEKLLDGAISRGFEEVARLRRELHVVIQDAFEELVNDAQMAGEGVYFQPSLPIQN